ncbi:nitrite reductase small subunit NirD [Sphingomonas sp. RS6]
MTDWIDIGTLADLPQRGSRTLTLAGEPVAVFRTHDDQVFALIDRCPHKGGPLSAGIVHGHAVACPLHNMRISLASGTALGEDAGCTPVVPVRVEGERILLALPVKAAA